MTDATLAALVLTEDVEHKAEAVPGLVSALIEARSLAKDWFWDLVAEHYGGVDEILEEFPWLDLDYNKENKENV